MKLPQYTYILIQFNTVASTAPFNCGQRNTLTQYRKIFCVLLQNQKYCQIYRLTSQFTSKYRKLGCECVSQNIAKFSFYGYRDKSRGKSRFSATIANLSFFIFHYIYKSRLIPFP